MTTRRSNSGADGSERSASPIRYLSRAEVAERIGVKSATLSRYQLPPEDARIGDVRGWAAETIDAWNATRPGRGNRWR